jgi:CRISPR-associated endonuclease/helicase Cas3
VGAAAKRGDPRSLAVRLWGKSQGLLSPYPLAGHLIDTSAVAAVLARDVVPSGLWDVFSRVAAAPPSAVASSFTALAGLHDLGKATCGFQNLVLPACPVELQGAKDGPFAGRHAEASFLLAWDRFETLGWRTQACQILGGHHGVIPSSPSPMVRRFGGAALVDGARPIAELEGARSELAAMVREVTGADLADMAAPAPVASIALAVVVLADWLASQEWFLRAQQERNPAHDQFDPSAWHARALDLATNAVRQAGLARVPLRAVPEQALFPFPLSALQASVVDSFRPAGAGIVVMTAPTGEGKTEAALLAARAFGLATGRSGFFFAMPTTATADALVGRLARFISVANGPEARLALVHSLASMYPAEHASPTSSDAETARLASRWLLGGRRGLLGPFGVGTIDQVLLGGLRVKHSPLRLFGAATKTLIVDEAHTFDPYMRGLLVRVLEWLGRLGVPVVVASATLPSGRAAELVEAYRRGTGDGSAGGPVPAVPYPGWVAWDATTGEFTSAAVPARRAWTLALRTEAVEAAELGDRIVSAALDACSDGGCVLVVRSTVREAQRTAAALRQRDPSLAVGLLHARLKVRERRSRAESLEAMFGPAAQRPDRYVLVATQVVEQSLDVDFDVLICDPAPVGQLVQRAGRVHRHVRPSRPRRHQEPVAVVMHPARDGALVFRSPIYPEADLRAAAALVGDERTVAVPNGVAELVEAADRFSEPGDAAWERAATARAVSVDVDTAAAATVRIPSPDRVADLADLTSLADPDGLVAGTRLGVTSVRILPVWPTTGGFSAFGEHGEPLPEHAPVGEQARSLFDETILVPDYGRSWLRDLPEAPGEWKHTPLGEIRLLVMPAGSNSIAMAGWRITADPYLGLVDERDGR